MKKKKLAHSFSYYRVWQTTGDSLWGSARFVDFYCACCKVDSLGPTRFLKTHFIEKKANFPVKKSFWHILAPIIESDKPQGTVSISPEAILTITSEKLRSYLQDLRCCWKFLEKSNLSSEEKFMAPFFVYYRVSQTSKDSL